LFVCYIITIFAPNQLLENMGRPKNEDLDDILCLNPRINSKVKKDFQKKVFMKRQQGVDINMSTITRSFIEKFNEDPELTLEFLNII
tara:strand:- start:862 stop:1122 length:261 start_codon:yes stop_codon:yes gene_type:complete